MKAMLRYIGICVLLSLPCPSSTLNDIPFAGVLCKFILKMSMCIVRQLVRITQLNLQTAGDHSVPSLMLVF